VRSGIRAPGRRIGVMDIMLGCVGDRFLYGDNVSNLYKATKGCGVVFIESSIDIIIIVCHVMGINKEVGGVEGSSM